MSMAERLLRWIGLLDDGDDDPPTGGPSAAEERLTDASERAETSIRIADQYTNRVQRQMLSWDELYQRDGHYRER
jgi:hypothetical protein